MKTRGCGPLFYRDVEKLETLRARHGGGETSVGNVYEITGNRLRNRLHRTTFYGGKTVGFDNEIFVFMRRGRNSYTKCIR